MPTKGVRVNDMSDVTRVGASDETRTKFNQSVQCKADFFGSVPVRRLINTCVILIVKFYTKDLVGDVSD